MGKACFGSELYDTVYKEPCGQAILFCASCVKRVKPDIYTCVMGKRGNVEINNSPQVGIEQGASRFKIQHSTE